jgi:hypothetical protein
LAVFEERYTERLAEELSSIGGQIAGREVPGAEELFVPIEAVDVV